MYLHLIRLKARILPPELAESTRYDARLAPMAAGVARAFDHAAARQLIRAVEVVESFPGGSQSYSLARYPVEAITSAVLHHPGGGTTDLPIARSNAGAGLVHFHGPAGTGRDDLRITLSGGYWVDLSEDGSEELPDGAQAMPEDLIDAWCLQCDHEARLRRIFGGSKSEDVAKAIDAAAYDLIPRVRAVLRGYTKLI